MTPMYDVVAEVFRPETMDESNELEGIATTVHRM
jgi:hypothetical protein